MQKSRKAMLRKTSKRAQVEELFRQQDQIGVQMSKLEQQVSLYRRQLSEVSKKKEIFDLLRIKIERKTAEIQKRVESKTEKLETDLLELRKRNRELSRSQTEMKEAFLKTLEEKEEAIKRLKEENKKIREGYPQSLMKSALTEKRGGISSDNLLEKIARMEAD